MKIVALALVVAAAAGSLLGYAVNAGRRSAVAPTIRVRTVTVTKIVTSTVRPTPARPDARAGKRVFASACSRCHALRPGDWTRNRINLTALRPSYSGTLEKVARGGIAMPSFRGRLSPREIRDVAAFVSREAARRARAAG